MGTIAEKLAYLKETKRLIKEKLTGNGVTITDDDSFRSYADKIDEISTGIDLKLIINWSYFNYYGYRDPIVPQLKYTDTSNGTEFINMCYNASNLTSIPSIDTSNGTNFQAMFEGCTSLISIPFINTSKGTNFIRMFRNCESLIELPALDFSGNTKHFDYTFYNCKLLKSIPIIINSVGSSCAYMFYGCSSLIEIPDIDTSTSSAFSQIFYNCSSLITIPRLNLSHVSTSYSSLSSDMFYNCTSLENVTFEGTFPIEYNLTIFNNSPNLTVESLVSLINALVNKSTSSTYKITIGSTNLAKLSEEQVQVALNKRITLA